MSEKHLEINPADLHGTIDRMGERIESLEAENAGYRKDIETLYHANVRMREALEILKAEREDLRTMVEKMREEVERYSPGLSLKENADTRALNRAAEGRRKDKG